VPVEGKSVSSTTQESPCLFPPPAPVAPAKPAPPASPPPKVDDDSGDEVSGSSLGKKAPKPKAEDPRLRQLSDLWTRVWREETGGATYPSRDPRQPPDVQVWAGPKCADWRARKILAGKLPTWDPEDGLDVLGQVELVARTEIRSAMSKGFPCTFQRFATNYDQAFQRWQASRRGGPTRGQPRKSILELFQEDLEAENAQAN
jgi:hypothetical protein